jgi:hypothetical protein
MTKMPLRKKINIYLKKKKKSGDRPMATAEGPLVIDFFLKKNLRIILSY